MVEGEQFDKYRSAIEPLLKEKGFNYDDLRFYDLSAGFKSKKGEEEMLESISGKFITNEKKIYSFKLTFKLEGNVLEIKEKEAPKGVFSKLAKI